MHEHEGKSVAQLRQCSASDGTGSDTDGGEARVRGALEHLWREKSSLLTSDVCCRSSLPDSGRPNPRKETTVFPGRGKRW